MASTSGSNNTTIDDSDYWEPLYLSTIAGLSTCIGAAVVFCQPQQQHNDETTNGRPNPKKIRIVPPHTMAFSLALAGSVMVTVSVVSILPEVLMDDNYSDDGTDGTDGADGTSYKMIPIFSLDMFYRILFFALGSGLYFGLSKLLNVPEPEEVLDNVLLGGTSSGNSNHEHDYEHGQELIPLTTNIMNNKNGSFDKKDTNDNINNSNNNNNNGAPRSPLRERKNTKQTTATPSQIIGLPLLQSSPGDNNGKRKVGMSHCHSSSSSSKKDIEFPLPLSLPLSSASSSSASASASASSSSSSPPSLSFRSWTTGEDLGSNEKKKAWRVAVLLFVSLLVHNFPEGLAVAASALESTKLGVTVTVGIMIHNIPEGIAIAIPCLAARPDQPWLSFALASISGLAEPMGAFVALLFLRDAKGSDGQEEERIIFNLENILSFVAGIMVMVSLWELFPEAKRHASQTKKYFWYGTISGIIVMVMTELYLP